jgi:LuxR family maltose regulon positive regulatory protein
MVTVPGEPFAFNPPANLRGPTLFCLGLAYKFQGRLTEAARLFAEAETDAHERQNPHIVALALGHLGEIQAMQGQPQQARLTCERALKASETYPPRSSAFWGLAYVGLGDLAFDQGDLESAQANFELGVEFGKIWNAWECLLPGMLGLARIRAARGEWQAAYSLLDDLLERTVANIVMVRPEVEAQRAAFQSRQGDLAAAARWAAAFDANHPTAYRLQWEQNALVAAQIWLAQGKRDAAASLLTRLSSEAEAAGRWRTVQRIQQVNRSLQPATPRTAKIRGMAESLSDRELEVLRLMAEGLSNPEIARKLFLTPNTLKAHAHRIFGKLGVHGRMEAVNRARELGIL